MSDLKVACAITVRIAQLERTVESNGIRIGEQLKQLSQKQDRVTKLLRDLSHEVDKFEKTMRDGLSQTDNRIQQISNERKLIKSSTDRTTKHLEARGEHFQHDMDRLKMNVQGRIDTMSSGNSSSELLATLNQPTFSQGAGGQTNQHAL